MGSNYKDYNIPPSLQIPAFAIDHTADDIDNAVKATHEALVYPNNNRNIPAEKVSGYATQYYKKIITRNSDGTVEIKYEETAPPTSAGENINAYGVPNYENTLLALQLTNHAKDISGDELNDTLYIKVTVNGEDKYYPYGKNEFAFIKINEKFIDTNSRLYKSLRTARAYLEEITSENIDKVLLVKAAEDGQPELKYDKIGLEVFEDFPSDINKLIGIDEDGAIKPLHIKTEHINENGLQNMVIMAGKQHSLNIANVTALLNSIVNTQKSPDNLKSFYDTTSEEWATYEEAYKTLENYALKDAYINKVTFDAADIACAEFNDASRHLADVEINSALMTQFDLLAELLYTVPKGDITLTEKSCRELGCIFYLTPENKTNTTLLESDISNAYSIFTKTSNLYRFFTAKEVEESSPLTYTLYTNITSESYPNTQLQYSLDEKIDPFSFTTSNTLEAFAEFISDQLDEFDNNSDIITLSSKSKQELLIGIKQIISDLKAENSALTKLRAGFIYNSDIFGE